MVIATFMIIGPIGALEPPVEPNTGRPLMQTSSRLAGMLATRDVHQMIADTEVEGAALKKTVGAAQLTAFGVGAIIGTGIFVVIGEGAAEAGPAVILSFVLAAVACIFSALSYAELASAIPVSGSAYTYSYATLGELVAWIIGWDLILEYGVSVAAVAVGWGGNFNSFLDSAFGFELPDSIALSPEDGGIFNLPAVVIVLAITYVLVLGVRESARTNFVMVAIKLVVLVFFLIAAFTAFSTKNFHDFAPEGRDGVVSAAAIIFFAFIGFDAVSTGSEEARNPRRDLPLAIIGSLAICTLFYVLVAVGAIGIATPKQMSSSDAPLATALKEGAGLDWAAAILAFGAVVAITSVILVIMYGQTRIFFAMCRDGLLPRQLATVHPRYGTPALLTVGMGVLIAILAALVPLSEIIKLVNIGTLFAFVLVNAGVIILRRTRPDMARPYRVPFSPVFPLLGIAFAIYLMADLPLTTWIRFVVWLVVGIAIYLLYGYSHSKLRRDDGALRGPEGPRDPEGRRDAEDRRDPEGPAASTREA
jgi:APA family basic amino acid/polyamine antiporter